MVLCEPASPEVCVDAQQKAFTTLRVEFEYKGSRISKQDNTLRTRHDDDGEDGSNVDGFDIDIRTRAAGAFRMTSRVQPQNSVTKANSKYRTERIGKHVVSDLYGANDYNYMSSSSSSIGSIKKKKGGVSICLGGLMGQRLITYVVEVVIVD